MHLNLENQQKHLNKAKLVAAPPQRSPFPRARTSPSSSRKQWSRSSPRTRRRQRNCQRHRRLRRRLASSQAAPRRRERSGQRGRRHSTHGRNGRRLSGRRHGESRSPGRRQARGRILGRTQELEAQLARGSRRGPIPGAAVPRLRRLQRLTPHHYDQHNHNTTTSARR